MSDRPLSLVDPDTGEITDECPGCRRLAGELEVAEGDRDRYDRDARTWATRYRNLARDKEAEARGHDLWNDLERLFAYWAKVCRHEKSQFDADRFHEALPHYKRHGEAMCRRAIDGAAYDAFTTKRKNGSDKRHDGWRLIFRDSEKFEEFCCKAPTQTAPH